MQNITWYSLVLTWTFLRPLEKTLTPWQIQVLLRILQAILHLRDMLMPMVHHRDMLHRVIHQLIRTAIHQPMEHQHMELHLVIHMPHPRAMVHHQRIMVQHIRPHRGIVHRRPVMHHHPMGPHLAMEPRMVRPRHHQRLGTERNSTQLPRWRPSPKPTKKAPEILDGWSSRSLGSFWGGWDDFAVSFREGLSKIHCHCFFQTFFQKIYPKKTHTARKKTRSADLESSSSSPICSPRLEKTSSSVPWLGKPPRWGLEAFFLASGFFWESPDLGTLDGIQGSDRNSRSLVLQVDWFIKRLKGRIQQPTYI